MLKTIPVTAKFIGSDNQPVSASRLVLTLDRGEVDTDTGMVVPLKWTAELDPKTGTATFDVWPNALGRAGSAYNVALYYEDMEVFTGSAVIPNDETGVLLHDYVEVSAFPARSVSIDLVNRAIRLNETTQEALQKHIQAKDPHPQYVRKDQFEGGDANIKTSRPVSGSLEQAGVTITYQDGSTVTMPLTGAISGGKF